MEPLLVLLSAYKDQALDQALLEISAQGFILQTITKTPLRFPKGGELLLLRLLSNVV
jgi:hypothetical protein